MDGGNTINRADLTQAVREAALLADVTISMWSAERSDAQLTEELKRQHGATGNVGRFQKNMLAGADGKLKDVHSAFRAVRTLHYGLTLPWVSDPHAERQRGPRLLPHALFDRYLADLSKQKRVANQLLDDFIDAYPSLVEQARANLGGMADAKYPSADEVRAAFRVGFDFEPIASGDSFKGLPPHVVDRLAHNLHAKQARMVSEANRAIWETARERVQHIVERLSDSEAKFKSSTITNVRELVTLLPGWGSCTGAEHVAEIAADIEKMLAGVEAETLRKDARMRADVATQAKAVVGKLDAWGL